MADRADDLLSQGSLQKFTLLNENVGVLRAAELVLSVLRLGHVEVRDQQRVDLLAGPKWLRL